MDGYENNVELYQAIKPIANYIGSYENVFPFLPNESDSDKRFKTPQLRKRPHYESKPPTLNRIQTVHKLNQSNLTLMLPPNKKVT